MEALIFMSVGEPFCFGVVDAPTEGEDDARCCASRNGQESCQAEGQK